MCSINNPITNPMNNTLYDQGDNIWSELQTYTQSDTDSSNSKNSGSTHVITSAAVPESNEELESLYLLFVNAWSSTL